MEELMEALKSRVAAGEDLALVTVAAWSGSAPRGAGAWMLVGEQGRLLGTVGGGIIERRAEELAGEAIASRTGCLRAFSLEPGRAESVGMVCGGDVTLLVQFLPRGDAGLVRAAEETLALLRSGGAGWLVQKLGPADGLVLLDPAEAATRYPALAQAGEDCRLWTAEGETVFARRLGGEGTVWLFGAGHVARELAVLLERLDFRFGVVDDRADFARPEQFPGAARVVCTGFERALEAVSPSAEDYAVVMTHGHSFDLEVQRQLLTTPVSYIGVMGSRKKKDFIFGKLREEGFTGPDLARIVTPVGLPLGGETPAEIALSVAAQLVELRAARKKTAAE